MKRNSQTQIDDAELGQLFLPPRDLGEPPADVWGQPWERQVAAAAAWQAAAGDDDGSSAWPSAANPAGAHAAEHRAAAAGRGTPAAGGERDAAPRRPTMTTIARMNTLTVSLREQLQRLQHEAADVAIAEMALRRGPPPEPGGESPALRPLPQLDEAHARRIVDIAGSWFAAVAAAQAGMSALLAGGPANDDDIEGDYSAAAMRLIAERRKTATVIGFPDRRAAA